MTTTTFALIKNGSISVDNIIVADSTFKYPGYNLVEIESDVFCEPGMYYNKDDGLFYADSEFISLTGTVTETDSE